MLILTRISVSLGEKTFCQLIQHIAVGNQIVIQPLSETALGPLVVDAIAKLIPRGCRKQVSGFYLAPPFDKATFVDLVNLHDPKLCFFEPNEQYVFFYFVQFYLVFLYHKTHFFVIPKVTVTDIKRIRICQLLSLVAP